ncbi:MAG: hypothetical protein V3V08_02120 [Nannocystaceae bacterium]
MSKPDTHQDPAAGGDSGGAAGEAEPPSTRPSPPEASDDSYLSLFKKRSFGGEFVWADTPGYVAKILRVSEGENVTVSTEDRRDVTILLTGGRAVLEIKRGSETKQLELKPAAPQQIHPGHSYRLLALSEVELFTIFTRI